MGARMPCFPHLDSPSVLGASGRSYRANRHWPHSSRLQAEARKREKLKDLPTPMAHHSCFPVWTTRCPNAVVSPFGPSICARLSGLFGRLAAIVGPLGSLWGRPKAPMSLSEALLEAPQAYEELTRSRGAYAI